MQELLGRLTRLDPEALETLKVISYFDTLTTARVGMDALARGAAALTGAVIGVQTSRRSTWASPEGTSAGAPDPGDGPRLQCELRDGVVWLTRPGPWHASDQMVLERLALAVELVLQRAADPRASALDIVVDRTRPHLERVSAAGRLGLAANTAARVVAVPHDQAQHVSGAPSTVAVTTYGLARIWLERTGHDSAAHRLPGPARVGLGVPVLSDALPDSLDTAVMALRLTTPDGPVVDAADLGLLLLAVRAMGAAGVGHPDVRALVGLDERERLAVRALAETASVRAAARVAGVHHSSLQARHEALTRKLGYDPASPLGRTRFSVAMLVLQLAESGIDRGDGGGRV